MSAPAASMHGVDYALARSTSVDANIMAPGLTFPKESLMKRLYTLSTYLRSF